MAIEDLRKDSEPFDRLTKLCQTMTDALDQAIAEERRDIVLAGDRDTDSVLAEAPDVKGIIFLTDGDQGGIEMFGYDDTMAGMADLLVHMKAVFTTMGKGFGVMTDQGVMLLTEEP